MKAWAIIAAAGIGKRMGGGRPKQYLEVGGLPIICHTLRRFRETGCIESCVIVVEPGREAEVRAEILDRYDFPKKWQVVAGGAVRQESVANGLACIPVEIDVVAVHDGVRPFVTPQQIAESVEVAQREGAAIVAAPIKETIKRVGSGAVVATVDRHDLWGAKTPQCFRRALLVEAMEFARREGFIGTDEASLVERLGRTVRIIAGDDRNIKITTPEDLIFAEAIWKEWRP